MQNTANDKKCITLSNEERVESSNENEKNEREELTSDQAKTSNTITLQNNVKHCSITVVSNDQESKSHKSECSDLNICPNRTQGMLENLSTLNNEESNSSNENKENEKEQPTEQAKIDSTNKIILNNIDNNIACSSSSTADVTNDQETKPQRDKCHYGNSCYRKNFDHKKDFSHPGDSDYESDPNDTRPTCRYGSNCYRKNNDHRKKYKHSGINIKQIPKGNHANKKRKCTEKKQKDYDSDDSDNEYDFDDPFLNDDSEDAYNEESWSESDSSDDSINPSNTNEEDNEDTGTLFKEAKRFTKRKK